MWDCAFSVYKFIVWLLWECVYFILLSSSNRKYEPLATVLGLGHGRMVRAVCLSVFICTYNMETDLFLNHTIAVISHEQVVSNHRPLDYSFESLCRKVLAAKTTSHQLRYIHYSKKLNDHLDKQWHCHHHKTAIYWIANKNLRYILGCWCQKQVSRTGITNCIPLFFVGCNYLFMSEIPASGTKVFYSWRKEWR